MTSAVTSSAPGSACLPGGNLPACSTSVNVVLPALRVTKTADTTAVVAGSQVHYTVTLANTGETDYTPAGFTDTLVGVVDDATYDANAVASIGTVSYTEPPWPGVARWRKG